MHFQMSKNSNLQWQFPFWHWKSLTPEKKHIFGWNYQCLGKVWEIGFPWTPCTYLWAMGSMIKVYQDKLTFMGLYGDLYSITNIVQRSQCSLIVIFFPFLCDKLSKTQNWPTWTLNSSKLAEMCTDPNRI